MLEKQHLALRKIINNDLKIFILNKNTQQEIYASI
jgi:hypothetical protein